MTIVLNGDTGIIVSGNTNTFTGVTVGEGGGEIATNTAVGASALAANTTGATNAAFGASALAANTSGSNNVAIGRNCMALNTTGANNTAIGRDASYGNTTGTNNTALGYRALDSNTASSNTGIGTDALRSNSTASNNTAVGYQAGYTNATGIGNVFVGRAAGYTSNGSGNAYNTIVGDSAGYSLTTGTSNTFIGSSATANSSGYFVTTGSKNTIIGGYSGNQGGLDIRTASNRIVLSDGDGNPRLIGDNSGAFFINRTSTYSYANGALCVEGTGGNPCIVAGTAGTTSYNNMVFGNGNGGVGSISTNGSSTAFNTSSDYRLKNTIAPMTGALDKVALLKPVTYKWNVDGSNGQGFIAHELQEVVEGCVTGEKDAVDADGNPQYQGIDTSFLVATLTAAIQEQQALITQLQADVALLKGTTP